MCRTPLSRTRSAFDHQPNLVAKRLLHAVRRWDKSSANACILISIAWWMSGHHEMAVVRSAGVRPERKEQCGVSSEHPHTCFLSLQENAPTRQLPHNSGCAIADPCTTITSVSGYRLAHWFSSLPRLQSMAKIDIMQDLAAGPEQTNAVPG